MIIRSEMKSAVFERRPIHRSGAIPAETVGNLAWNLCVLVYFSHLKITIRFIACKKQVKYTAKLPFK